MIPNKIAAVFDFIDFLYSNTAEFSAYLPIVEEALELKRQYNLVDSNNSYEDRVKSNKLNKEKNSRFDTVKTNVIDVITQKAIDLDICCIKNHGGYSGPQFNWGFSEIQELKHNANDDDLKPILENKFKYVTFRSVTNSYFLGLGFFFNDLDEYLLDLFKFFDKESINEFAPFLVKTVKVNTIREAVKVLSGKEVQTEQNEYDKDIVSNEKESNSIIPKRVLIGSYFLSGIADEKYLSLKSWRQVAKSLNLSNFNGQFSATAKKEKSFNENDVFATHQKEILEYCTQNNIKIKRKDYLKT